MTARLRRLKDCYENHHDPRISALQGNPIDMFPVKRCACP